MLGIVLVIMGQHTPDVMTVRILEAAIRGETKPVIMSKAFQSYEQLQKCLRSLIDEGLIDNYGRRFKTSDKGLRFIERSKQSSLNQNDRTHLVVA
jgi:predicted transcriptional regulator